MPNLNSPILTGDVSGGLHTTSVDKLKGQPVASTAPSNGQVLTWDGTAWAPATASTGGGGGANGLTYYLRFDQAADAPTTNLPGTPKQLGRTGAVAQSSVTSGTLTSGTWTLLAGFVSESVPIDPNITSIPGGLWDINAWALGTANQQSPTSIRAKIYTYDGANVPTLISTSGEQVINTMSAQYSLSALVPQTDVTSTTRIYVEIEVRSTANGHTATLQFGDGTPSHVHTSLPLVGGSGLWRSISGVLQPNGTQISDADVASSAAIAQSKIANLTTDLAGKQAALTTSAPLALSLGGTGAITASAALAALGGTKTADVQVFTSNGTWTKPAGAKAVHITCIGAGGGGASGRVSAGQQGGGGGAGGSFSERLIPASVLGATEAVTVGVGGPGGVATSAVNAQNNVGTKGGDSLVGTWISATGGDGGGTVGAGGAASNRFQFQGGSGGSGGSAAAGNTGGNSGMGGAGGGGGGGINNPPTSQFGGGIGGAVLTNGVTGGTSAGGTAGGGNGANGASTGSIVHCGGGGAGGGSSLASNGGNGGNGGLYGGGGGGGGAVAFGFTSGAGGSGANGIVVITTYF